MYDTLLDHEIDEDSSASSGTAEFQKNVERSEGSSGTMAYDGGETKETEVSPELEETHHELESWSDDPVRMYLTQMGEIPLLTRQQEINLARCIETTRTDSVVAC